MNIIKDFVPKEKYNLKCPYTMTPEFIVVHNTANDASAAGEVSYMKNNNSSVSFHVAVDDVEIRQAVPLNRNAWHAGDGTYGEGNRKGIAIEICYSYCQKKINGKWVPDEEKWQKYYKTKFEKAEENAAELVAYLLNKYGWDITGIKKHQDFSGKYCPHRTLDSGWDRFLRKVEENMAKFKDIEGHWAQKHIEKLHKYGIVNGTSENTFSPDRPITRAEAAVMIANAITYLGK